METVTMPNYKIKTHDTNGIYHDAELEFPDRGHVAEYYRGSNLTLIQVDEISPQRSERLEARAPATASENLKGLHSTTITAYAVAKISMTNLKSVLEEAAGAEIVRCAELPSDCFIESNEANREIAALQLMIKQIDREIDKQ